MKFIRLLKYTLSRNLIRELFLVIQLSLMLLFAFSILSPVDDYAEMLYNLEKLYSFDFSTTMFFNPNVAAYQAVDESDSSIEKQLELYLTSLSGDMRLEKMMRMSYTSTQIRTGKTKQDPHTGDIIEEVLPVNFLVYRNEYSETSNIKLLDGSFSYDGCDQYVSVAVSKSLSDIIPIGSICDLNLSSTEDSTSCIVTAILADDCILPSTYGFSSFPTLMNIGTRIADVEGAHFIIAIAEEESVPGLDWEYSCFITVQNVANAKELCNEFNEQAGSLGTWYIVNDIVYNSFNSILQSNSTLIFECILLSLIAIFGYGGYLYLSICRRQKDFSILYILGLTRKQSIIINTISGVLILCVSYLIARIAYPYFLEILGISNQSSLGIVSIVFCCIFFIFILLLSYIAAFHQFSKVTTISLYQGGD